MDEGERMKVRRGEREGERERERGKKRERGIVMGGIGNSSRWYIVQKILRYPRYVGYNMVKYTLKFDNQA